MVDNKRRPPTKRRISRVKTGQTSPGTRRQTGPVTKSQYQRWVAAMQANPRGRVVLGNIAHELETSRLPETHIGSALLIVLRSWRAAGWPDPTPDMGDALEASAPSLALSGLPRINRCPPCSRVTAWLGLVKRNIANLPALAAYLDHVPRAVKDKLQVVHGLDEKARGTIPFGDKMYAWITTRGALDDIRKSVDSREVANAVRRLLGLCHYDVGADLVEILYPDDIFVTVPVAPPTFCEGTQGFAYRSFTAADGLGRAVDLKTAEPAHPEAVHGRVDFVEAFSLRDVGPVWRMDDTPDLFEKMEACLQHPWRPEHSTRVGLLVIGK